MWSFLLIVAQSVKTLPAMQETQVRFLGWEDPLEKEMATASSYSCLENPMDRGAWKAIVHGVTRVGHDLATKPPTTTVISVAPLDGQGLFKTARTEISSSVALSAFFILVVSVSSCCMAPSASQSVLSDFQGSQLVASINFSMKPRAASIVPAGAPAISAALSHRAWLPSPSPCLSGVSWWNCCLECCGFPAGFSTNSLLIFCYTFISFSTELCLQDSSIIF